MPEVYQARCTACGYESDVFPSGYGAVLVDEPHCDGPQPLVFGAAMLTDANETTFAEHETKFAAQDDPWLIVLAHPEEDRCLAETGYTWEDLAREGRYVAVGAVVCRNCKTLHEIRHLDLPGGVGCIVGLWLAAAFGVIVGLGIRLCWAVTWWGCLLSGVLAFNAWLIAWVKLLPKFYTSYVGRRFPARVQALQKTNPCPRCGSHEYDEFQTDQVIRCPVCSQQALRVDRVGFS